MVWYIVYEGYGRTRDGELYERTYVKKLRLGRIIGRPHITDILFDDTTDHVLVEVTYKKSHRYRGGKHHPRLHRQTVVLGQNVDIQSIHLTQHPPEGPKIDRR